MKTVEHFKKLINTVPMNKNVKQKLLEMVKLDEQVRSDLIRRGVLFDGYHPEMEQVHNSNADHLSKIIDECGWPTNDMVGSEGAEAAWLIVQHAIGNPQFQRKCLSLLKTEVKLGRIDAKQVAYLEDRICVFEGKNQIYGTQFDWDDNGKLSPKPIQDPEEVDALRKTIGLSPLAEVIEQMRLRADQEGNNAPSDIKKREEQFIQWARKVGWRK